MNIAQRLGYFLLLGLYLVSSTGWWGRRGVSGSCGRGHEAVLTAREIPRSVQRLVGLACMVAWRTYHAKRGR